MIILKGNFQDSSEDSFRGWNFNFGESTGDVSSRVYLYPQFSLCF